MQFKRVFLMVLDSLGVGETVDADLYGDTMYLFPELMNAHLLFLMIQIFF